MPNSDEWEQIEQTFAPCSQQGSRGRVENYEVVERMGRGGMGLVWRVHDDQGMPFALKVLRPSLNGAVVARLRFKSGGSTAYKLTHARLVKVWSLGELGDQEKYPYLVMDFLEGESLAEKLKAKQPLRWPEILWIAFELAEGLQFLHSEGFAHRDVKPGNVWILPAKTADDGLLQPNRLKLLDYDFLKDVRIDSEHSRDSIKCGTPSYGAPETFDGRGDERSDLWSMGVTLYEMCLGQRPFVQDDLMPLIKAISKEIPISLRKKNRDIPQWFSTLVSRLLEKKPGDRPQSAAEVLAAIKRGHTKAPRARKTRLSEKLGNEEFLRLQEFARKVLDSLSEDESSHREFLPYHPELLALLGLAFRVECAGQLAASVRRLETKLHWLALETTRLPPGNLDLFHSFFKEAIAAFDRNTIQFAVPSQSWPALGLIYDGVRKFLADGPIQEIAKLLETGTTTESVHATLRKAASAVADIAFKMHIDSRRLLGDAEQALKSALRQPKSVQLNG